MTREEMLDEATSMAFDLDGNKSESLSWPYLKMCMKIGVFSSLSEDGEIASSIRKHFSCIEERERYVKLLENSGALIRGHKAVLLDAQQIFNTSNRTLGQMNMKSQPMAIPA